MGLLRKHGCPPVHGSNRQRSPQNTRPTERQAHLAAVVEMWLLFNDPTVCEAGKDKAAVIKDAGILQ